MYVCGMCGMGVLVKAETGESYFAKKEERVECVSLTLPKNRVSEPYDIVYQTTKTADRQKRFWFWLWHIFKRRKDKEQRKPRQSKMKTVVVSVAN